SLHLQALQRPSVEKLGRSHQDTDQNAAQVYARIREKSCTETLRDVCACGNYNSSACARASDGTFQVVRRSVGAPTAHACAGNGSHHPEDISPGRGGPPGELFRALLGAGTRRSRRRSAAEEPLWVDARGSLSRPDLVRREGDA